MPKEENRENFQLSCITPTLESLSTKETLLQVLESHDWDIDRADRNGDDAYLVKIHCSKCQIERIFIISNITESARIALQNRLVKEEIRAI